MIKANLAKNTTYFTAALTFQKILAFIYFWYISNNLLPDQLGQYIFALSFTTLFSILIDLGLSPVLTREASKNNDQANHYLQGVLGLKIPLAAITMVLVWSAITLSGKPTAIAELVYLSSFIMLLDSFSLTFWVIFRSQQNLKYESIATIIVQLIIFVLGSLAVKYTGQTTDLILALLVASIFNFLFSASLIKFRLKFSLRPKFNREISRYFLKLIPSFAIAGIFIKIYNTSDSVMLGYLANDKAVGFYAVPAKVVYAFQQVIPAAFAAVIFPAFSYYYTHSKDLLKMTFDKAFKYLTLISLPITAGLVTLAPQIITKIWPTYLPILPTFMVMALAIPFIFLAFPTGYLLNACDHQKNNTINRGIITALAVIFNLILIPEFGYFGAGLTFFATNFILLFLDFYWVKKVVPLDYRFIIQTLIKSTTAVAIMVVVVILIKPIFNLLIVSAFGALAYFIALYIFKGITWSEIKTIAKNQF
ncbi:MAG: flippase [Patescibacteria group bacterium]|nr:flippase [Patescibacteria group bacterium]